MHEVAPINPWVALAYLASGILFILALRGLSSPASSRRGNRYGMIGMAIAVGTTLIDATADAGVVTWLLIVVGIAIGGAGGAFIVEMSTAPGCIPCADLWARLGTLGQRYGWKVRTIGRKVLFDLCVTKVDCRVFRGMQPVGLRKRLDNRVVRLIHLAVNAQA